jgi:putative redox protein
MTDLATSSANAQLSNQLGRALLSARGNHTAIDSTPPLGGPNEALNPIDLLLGALATCGAFLFETTARNEGITLDDVSVTVEGDFDARGITDNDINPRIQQYRAVVRSTGPNDADKQRLAEAFKKNCPIFTTLAAGAPIELIVE